MIEWILNNKEWIFSGVGVAAISTCIGWLIWRHKKSSVDISANNRSVAAQEIKNCTISTGDTTDK